MAKEGKKREPMVVISGQSFIATYPVSESITIEPSLHISQEAFPLCEADFLRLKHGVSKALRGASALFLTGLGIILVPIAKFVQGLVSQVPLRIELWEWLAPVASFVIASALWGMGQCLPNERKQVLKDIETHFSEAPRVRHLGGKNR
jgi:hypothetical protein